MHFESKFTEQYHRFALFYDSNMDNLVTPVVYDDIG